MMATGRMLAALAFDWVDSLLGPLLALVVVLLIGATAVALVKRWRQKGTSESMSPSEQLAEFRSLYDRGAMSKEEFDRLRALLGGQLRDVKSAAPEPVAQEKNAAVIQTQPAPAQPLPPATDVGAQTPPAPHAGNGPA